MIKIRSNVFETNSSSTHSVCIEKNYKERFIYQDLPENTTITIRSNYLNQFEDNGMNDTEWQKLIILIELILGIKNKYGSEKHLCKDYIEILKKIVKDERNLTLNFDFNPEKRSPYYNDFADDDDIFTLFDFKPNDDAESIYDIFKNFVFNKDVTMRYQVIMD